MLLYYLRELIIIDVCNEGVHNSLLPVIVTQKNELNIRNNNRQIGKQLKPKAE